MFGSKKEKVVERDAKVELEHGEKLRKVVDVEVKVKTEKEKAGLADKIVGAGYDQYEYLADQASSITGQSRSIAGPLALALLVGLLSSLFFWMFMRKGKKQTVLMLGPRGSGKTHVFGKVASHKFIDTVTSRKENAVKITFSNKTTPVSLIDVPSSDRLNGKILHRYEGAANGVIFILDGSKFDGYSKDVASYLYDVMVDTKLNNKPMLIVINKAEGGDSQIAEVRRTLEVELDAMRKNPANKDNVMIGVKDRQFSFKDVSSEPEWVTLRDISGEKDNLETKARLANVDPGIEKIKKWLAYL